MDLKNHFKLNSANLFKYYNQNTFIEFQQKLYINKLDYDDKDSIYLYILLNPPCIVWICIRL